MVFIDHAEDNILMPAVWDMCKMTTTPSAVRLGTCPCMAARHYLVTDVVDKKEGTMVRGSMLEVLLGADVAGLNERVFR